MEDTVILVPWHENKIPKIKWIIFVLVCATVVAFAAICVFVVMHFRQNSLMVKTDAIIEEIETYVEREYDSTNKQWVEKERHIVYVTYTVDEVQYTHVELGTYDAGMHVGDTIKIVYDANDPSKITSQNSFLIMAGIAAFIFVISLILTINRIKSYKPEIQWYKNHYEHQQYLKDNGDKYTLKIVRHFTNDEEATIECMIDNGEFDPDTALISEAFHPITTDLTDWLVDVYIDKVWQNDYYIDITSVRKG